MDLALLVYGISLLENFSKLFGFLLFFSGAAALFSGIHQVGFRFDSYEYSWNCNKDGTVKASVLANRALSAKILKWSFFISLILAFIMVLLPSQKTAYTMVGAYAAQKVSQDERVQETGSKVMQIINQKLDQYIDEGIKEVTDEVKSRRNKSKD
jgi:hypothetical protein